ncbi:hypothetical protein GCM10009806_24560 [Microbacterium flavum]
MSRKQAGSTESGPRRTGWGDPPCFRDEETPAAASGGVGVGAGRVPPVRGGVAYHLTMTRAGVQERGRAPVLYSAERPKAFIDAVVAIAMTLLILPLMESVSDAADAEGTALDWLGDHRWQLTSFVLSFAIIAMFWLNHQRLFSGVQRVSTTLLWISMAWLLSIVWLPVATALSGRMPDDDALTKAIYIGSMILTALVATIQRVYVLRHRREFGEISTDTLRGGLSADISMCILFSVALVVSITIPAVNYNALFVMLLMGPMQALVRRLLPPLED